MSFQSSSVSIGNNTKKSDYDLLLDNTQNNRSRASSLESGTVAISHSEIQTFNSGTVFNSTATFSSDIKMSGTVLTGIKTDGTFLKTKVIALPTWDMDTVVSKNVAHGLTLADIRKVEIFIYDDNHDFLYNFSQSNNGASTNQWIQIDSANVVPSRATGGLFDGISFNNTALSRGWIVITYEA